MFSKVSVIFIVHSLFVFISSSGTRHSPEVETARLANLQEILKYLNESANPCDNFFHFACGNWKTYHPANESIFPTRRSDVILREFDNNLVKLLGNITTNDTEAERKVKYVYSSCLKMDADKQSVYMTRIKEIVDNIFKMPAMEGEKWLAESDFDWLKTVADIFYKYAIGIMLYPRFDQVDRNLYLDYTSSADIHEECLEVFISHFFKSNNLSGEVVAKEINDFHQKLIDIPIESPETFEINRLSHQNFDLKKFVNISLGYLPSGLITYSRMYLNSLADLLKATPTKVTANYIYFLVFTEFYQSMPFNNDDQSTPCLEFVKTHFKSVISSMFYRSQNFKKAEEAIKEVGEHIRESLELILKSPQLSLYTDKDRKNALAKLRSMKILVANFNETDLNAYYEQLHVNKNDFLTNIQSVLAFSSNKKRNYLNETTLQLADALDFFTPLYLTTSNLIVIPVSTLAAEPYYSIFHPHALQMSRIGVVLAHEIFHGFCGGGNKYNEVGELVNYFDAHTKWKLKERHQCFYEQYSRYTPQQEEQSENLADNGGLLLAFASYYSYPDDEKHTLEILPNLNYTNEQLFFIHYAQMFCCDKCELPQMKSMESDDHAPPEFRALIPLTNIPRFSDAFKCPSGSAMNPTNKCYIFP